MAGLALLAKLAGFKKDPLQSGRLHKETLVDPKLDNTEKSMICHSCG
jgi:hypothetical protein